MNNDILSQLQKPSVDALLDALRNPATEVAPGPSATKPQKRKREEVLAEEEKERQKDDRPPAEQLNLKSSSLVWRREVKGKILLNEAGIEKAMEQIRELPEPGWSVHAIMGGDYHGWDIVPTVHRLCGQTIRELHIATLGFSKTNAVQLAYMLDAGYIERAAMVCSQYFAKADAPIYAGTKAELESRGQRIVHTRSRAKVILIRTDDWNLVIESSANLRSCNNLEQFAIHHDAELLAWHREWMEHLLANPSE